jgi:predicted nucleotidyltransferase
MADSQELPRELVQRLQKAHADRLVSVVLYGSAAVPGAKDRLSDYNILCVLKDVTLEELRASEPVFRWWREMKNPSPLLLGQEELRTCTDCFPMEFHDIQERHQILFGDNVVADLPIDDRFYRAMVEHELRAKLLRLRQKAAGILSENDLLLRLMADSVSTFCVLLRHALKLAGEEPLYDKHKVIAAASNSFGIDAQPFETLLNLREDKVKPRDLQPVPLFREYLRQIQNIVTAVDRINE